MSPIYMSDPVERSTAEGSEGDGALVTLPEATRRIDLGATLLDRFDILGKLGQGGMGHVYLAYDRLRQSRVALKVIGGMGPDAINEIKREFRAAAGLVHPNLVRLHELFCEGEWFFTMDLVEGTSLATVLGERDPAYFDRMRHVFRQLALGLRELHRTGALHGDLKPSNFLITGEENRVVLLDFGLSRPLGREADVFAGTPAYMAPEQVTGDTLTEAADWYSFGVVLHEALTGQLPIRRASFRMSGVPADLVDLCRCLLALSAENRPSGDEVCRRLGLESNSERTSSTPGVARPVLINRSAELQGLRAALDDARRGTPAIVLLQGASGIGKSAIVECFIDEAARDGAVIFTSVCRERESMGHKALDGLIDDVVAFLNGLEPEAARTLLPERSAELLILFPALTAVRGLAARPERPFADKGALRQRAIEAFRELLKRVRQRAALVLWIDDLQWSDAESAALIERLFDRGDPVPVLFIGSHRSGTVDRGPLLDALLRSRGVVLPEPREFEVGPLPVEESQALALELLQGEEDAEAVAAGIAREAEGHPLFITQLAIARGEPSNENGAPSTLVNLVSRRLRDLSPTARRLLEAIAVAGAPRSRALLRKVHRLHPAEAEDTLDVLRARHLVRTTGLRDADTIDMHHDRIRQIVVQELAAPAHREWHLAFARAMEDEPDLKPEFVAAHYEAGGETARAGAFWLRGAEEAFEGLAFAHAAELFERGAELSKLDGAERVRVSIRRAEALAYAGRGALAAGVYLAVAEETSPEEALELRRRAAEQLLLSGHVDPGLAVIERVLEELGMPRLQGPRRTLLSIAASRVLVRAKGLRYRLRDERAISRQELARVDVSWSIACSLSVIDVLHGAEFQNWHLIRALRAGESRRLLRALTLEISFAATPGTGSERRTARLLRVASSLADSVGDGGAMGLLHLARGIAAYLRGEHASALVHCQESLRTLSDEGARAVWEMVTARRFAIAALYFLGRLEQLSAFVSPLVTEAEATGNVYARMVYLAGYSTAAWLARDEAVAARENLSLVRAQWSGDKYRLSHYNVLVGEVFTELYEGDALRARALVIEQWPRISTAQLHRVEALRVQLFHFRAATACAGARSLLGSGKRVAAAAMEAEARYFAGRLRRCASPRARPLALLVDASLDALRGRIPAARSQLSAAIDVLDAQGLALFAAASRVGLGRLGDGRAGDALVASGLARLRDEGVVAPESMLRILAPGL